MSLEQLKAALDNEMLIYSGIQAPRQVTPPPQADAGIEDPLLRTLPALPVEPPLSRLAFGSVVAAALFMLLAAVYVLGR